MFENYQKKRSQKKAIRQQALRKKNFDLRQTEF